MDNCKLCAAVASGASPLNLCDKHAADRIKALEELRDFWKAKHDRRVERIVELDKALDDICEQVAVLDTRNAELEAKLDKVRGLLAGAQQTPLAPIGVTHVLADDLQSALGDKE